MQTYQPRKTTSFIIALGAVIMVIGIAAIIYGIVELLNPGPNNVPGITFIISGIGSVIAASLLYVIGNLSEDVHKLSYDVECLASQSNKYQKYMAECLQEVDRDHDAIKKGIATISSKLQ